MMTLQEAYKIVIANEPTMKAINWAEHDEFYMFNLVPRDLAKGDGFANSCVYTVWKDRSKQGWMYGPDMMKYWPPIRMSDDVSTLEEIYEMYRRNNKS